MTKNMSLSGEAGSPDRPSGRLVDYQDTPLRSFHAIVTTASTGGVFSDGFGLGIIGISLVAAGSELTITPIWLGAVAASSLVGLFAGALLTGPIADNIGRRPIFAYNMALLAALSGAQFFVNTPAQLLIVRLLLGIVLGTDYVVAKALLTEFSPRRLRGRLLSILSVAWTAGYVCAYVVGYEFSHIGADAWRWMLASSAVPALLTLPLRLVVPESPLWLIDHGRIDQALRIVQKKLGRDVSIGEGGARQQAARSHWRRLFSSTWRGHTLIGCTFFTCQVIPYYAVGTFVTKVMAALNVQGSYAAGLAYNLLLLVGSIAGLFIVDLIPRRVFLIVTFAITAVAMLTLSASPSLSPLAITILFAVFAAVLSASQSLVYVYLPELFPTDLRASGIGLAIATSRIGSAASTFLLPIVVEKLGIQAALGFCVGALVFGGLTCLLWAPETGNHPLSPSVVDNYDPPPIVALEAAAVCSPDKI